MISIAGRTRFRSFSTSQTEELDRVFAAKEKEIVEF